MVSKRFRRLPRWVVCCLALLIPPLAGCGDYCLFCDGQGGGGGGNGTEQVCDNVFSGLAAYQAALNLQVIDDTFQEPRVEDDRLSLAVVPKGMSFEYGSNRTADPGDVILADQQASDIYVYEFGTSQTRRSLGAGVGQVSGVALLHYKTDADTDVDLLFFTVEAENTLYIYDLAGSTAPLPITNELLRNYFNGRNFFESPTALAVSAGAEKAVVFVLNDNGTNSSVRRLSLTLLPVPLPDQNSLQTVATMTESSRRLVDLAFFAQTDTLYVSKKTEGEQLTVGWVYKIDNASDRTGSVSLNPNSSFIAGGGAPTGLTAAFTNKTGTTADLLVLTEGDGQVLQYDIVSGGNPQDAFFLGNVYLYPLAVAYDCAHKRLLTTDVPFNPDIPRTFLEAFPSL